MLWKVSKMSINDVPGKTIEQLLKDAFTAGYNCALEAVGEDTLDLTVNVQYAWWSDEYLGESDTHTKGK